MEFTSFHLHIIAKYFNTIQDYVNLMKTCKEYKNVIDYIKYNPIDIVDFRVFKNLKEIHIYNDSMIPIYSLPTVIWYPVSYARYLKSNDKVKYKYFFFVQM